MIQVYYNRDYIRGFRFLDTELKTITEIGTWSGNTENVVLKDDEQILGISAKQSRNFETCYTDF